MAGSFGDEDFLVLGDLDLVLARALLTLPDAAALALLFFSTAKIPP